MALSLKLSFFIFLAGGLGANLRWVLTFLAEKMTHKLWTGTLIANVLGCLVFFLLSKYQPSDKEMDFILKTGLLGSLTTFSTFSYEVVTLLKSGRTAEALTVLVLNVFLGIIIGIGILR